MPSNSFFLHCIVNLMPWRYMKNISHFFRFIHIPNLLKYTLHNSPKRRLHPLHIEQNGKVSWMFHSPWLFFLLFSTVNIWILFLPKRAIFFKRKETIMEGCARYSIAKALHSSQERAIHRLDNNARYWRALDRQSARELLRTFSLHSSRYLPPLCNWAITCIGVRLAYPGVNINRRAPK